MYEQECIPQGCVLTAVVVTTRCQYHGGGLGRRPWRQIPPEADPTPEADTHPGDRTPPPFRGRSPL